MTTFSDEAYSGAICRACGRPTMSRDELHRFLSGEEEMDLDAFCDCGSVSCSVEAENPAERKARRRAAQVLRLMATSGIPEPLRSARMGGFDRDSAKRILAYRLAVDVAKAALDATSMFKPWLLIAGAVGTGKTYLAACLASDLIRRGLRVLWSSAADILLALRSTIDGDGSEREALERYTSSPVLVLDDLAKERMTAWAAEKLYCVVNARYALGRPVIITSNYSGNELADRLTPKEGDGVTAAAIIDRIRERCLVAVLDGASRRRAVTATGREEP